MLNEIKLLKVSSTSKPNSVAGAIAGMLRTESKVQVQTIGAGALNQAVKGIAIARGFIAPTGQELVCVPFFRDIEINGDVKTAIVLTIETR